MPPTLAFIFGLLFVAFMFVKYERTRATDVSPALIWPLLWYVLMASRSVAVWLDCLGISLPGSTDTDGNLIDRTVYFLLCLIGIFVLARRKVDWAYLRRENRWLILLFIFMFLSVAWSDYTWISFKRVIKAFAAATMVLVVLTDKDPFAAIESIIRRGAYILIPLSIIVVKYFRNIGVQYDWSGTGVSWCGLSTSKNTLGQVVMISALCFAWSIFRDFRRNQPGAIFNYIYLAMSLYLLKGSEKSISVTSLSVFVMGLLLLATSYRNHLNFRYLARLLTAACITIFCVQVILLVHTSDPFAKDSFLGLLIRGLGRDITLSGRTGIWSDVLTIAARSPLLGVGSGGFWIGRAANIPWDAHLTWVLGEGHNGYFDVYLQIGLIGVFLLLGIIFSARRGITRTFKDDFEYGMFRMTFLIIILFVNITESTFLRGDHLLWFMFLFCVISVPAMHRADLQTDPVGISGEAVAAEFT